MFCFAALDLVSRSDLHAMFHQDQLCVTRMFFVAHEKKTIADGPLNIWMIFLKRVKCERKRKPHCDKFFQLNNSVKCIES